MKDSISGLTRFLLALTAGGMACVTAHAQRPQGIDVSSYQGSSINWVSVKSLGVTFAWAKATEGTGYVDTPYYYINVTNARNAGVFIGAYHFARPDQNLGLAGADAEAAHFWSIVKNYIKKDGTYLQPALDMEQAPGGTYTKTTLSQWINRWCQDIVNYAAASNVAVRPIIYTGAYYADPWMDSTVTQWPVWLANYNGQDPQSGAPNSTSVWSNWNVWQYSSTNLVTGVPGNCDVNVFNGTSDDLGALLIIGGSNSPPIIGTQPVNASVATNGTISFGILAYGGLPLSYQWQKNSNNIANGGHYSGCASNTLTISSADISDVANYRCVVTNAYGTNTSVNAALNLIVSCQPNPLVNGSFEDGNLGGVGIGWINYQRTPVPGTSWSIQSAAPPTGGGTQYQQILNSSSTGGGGVRQNVTGCTVGSTYRIAGWMRGNSSSATCTVKCSPTASTSWSTATNLSPAQTYSGSTWTAFSGTIVATAPNMTVWLDGQTGSTGVSKAECFDAVTVTCDGPPVQPPAITSQPSPQTNCPGANPTFSVTATGDPVLTYQWQKNSTNLSNGGHYSDVTTATLTITGADSSDAANYRCTVSNSGGSTNSSAAALTVKAATSITQQPANRTVAVGGTTNFTVAATGDGTLTYQWQKNSTNLSNGGHYSGVTTTTLTISSASTNDAANYRCVATGGCGNATSFQASLAVGCSVNPLLNNSFEGATNVNGVATNWFGYQRSPNPTTVWTIQTASPPTGGGTQYQQIANTSSTGGGGVRQDVTGCIIGNTYTIAGWMRGNSASATCTVKCSPSASTSWATAVNLTPTQTYSGSTWTAFSGTVVATGTSMTVWLDGQTTGAGLNKAECFDAVTITCSP